MKCSLERPSCSQCMKSGRTCLWYERETIFISMSGSSFSSTTKKDHNRQRVNHKLSRSRPLSDSRLQPLSYHDMSRQRLDVVPEYVAIKNLYNSSIRQQMLGSYISQYHAVTN